MERGSGRRRNEKTGGKKWKEAEKKMCVCVCVCVCVVKSSWKGLWFKGKRNSQMRQS